MIELTNQHHLKNASFTFHDQGSDFVNGLRNIVGDISPINDRLKDNTYIVTRRVTQKEDEMSYGFHFDNYESTLLSFLAYDIASVPRRPRQKIIGLLGDRKSKNDI